MKDATLINIANIIEGDNKSSTYKFALLRGTIDIINQDYSNYKKFKGNRVVYPLGLLINKWIFYYYPLLGNSTPISQINNKKKDIAFDRELKEVISLDKKRGAEDMSVLYNEIRSGKIDDNLSKPLLKLYSKLKKTIIGMPMKHLGYSKNRKHYSIFQYHSTSQRKANNNFIDFTNGYGDFSIPVEYYHALMLLGSFISGQDSIISKWSDFSYSSSGKKITKSKIISQLMEAPTTIRDMIESINIYRKLLADTGYITCVWTNTTIKKFDVDHVIPFSVWKNNDLWNLLPALPKANNNKSNKIPSPTLIESSKDRIFDYWDLLMSKNEIRFSREIENGLLGQPLSKGWKRIALDKLKEKAKYLIQIRGYEEWKI